MSKPRILLIYTGGTIGMSETETGYAPRAGFLREQMNRMDELAHPRMPEYEILEYEPLLDSANMDWRHWLKLARDIESHYAAFDGFVILHGTDTLAYSASALAFMLQGLGKPVLFTGSQIPLCEVRSDARENLITSLLIAGSYRIPEVCVFFGQHLLRGCRAKKVNAFGFEAFQSPNAPPLGEVGTEITIRADLIRAAGEGLVPIGEYRSLPVGAIRLFPGITADIVRNVLQQPLQGLVIEAFGVGNCPSHNTELLQVIGEATARGVIVVAVTQCLQGRVDLHEYQAGKALADAQVISGRDLTAEAALAKLFYLLNRFDDVTVVRELMQTNLVGELT